MQFLVALAPVVNAMPQDHASTCRYFADSENETIIDQKMVMANIKPIIFLAFFDTCILHLDHLVCMATYQNITQYTTHHIIIIQSNKMHGIVNIAQ